MSLRPCLPFTSGLDLGRVLCKWGWDRVGQILYFFVTKNLKPIFTAVTFNFLLWDDIRFWGTARSCFSGSAPDLQVFFPELCCSSWPTFGSSWKAQGCGLRRPWRPQRNPDGDKPACRVLTEGAQGPGPSEQRHFRVRWEERGRNVAARRPFGFPAVFTHWKHEVVETQCFLLI